MHVSMTHKWFYTLVLLGVFLFTSLNVFGAYVVSSNTGHEYTYVSLIYQGKEMTLQSAIDEEYIIVTCTPNQIMKFNISGSGKWECDDTQGEPTLEQKVISRTGEHTEESAVSASCGLGWVRTGCSGGRGEGDSELYIRPGLGQSCRSVMDDDRQVTVYAHCMRLEYN